MPDKFRFQPKRKLIDKEKKDLLEKAIPLLKKLYPSAECALNRGNLLELLVATILSAQCTDERVNKVTPALFKRYKTAEDYARANQKAFEQEIRSTGFYKNKAKNIIASCKIIDEKFHGKVPNTMEELLELPGVARKTANIILTTGYGKVEGVVVDTHVSRLAQRLGLTSETDPAKIEQDLMALVPKNEWEKFSDRLIWHGRRVCFARKPNCPECMLNKICPSSTVSV